MLVKWISFTLLLSSLASAGQGQSHGTITYGPTGGGMGHPGSSGGGGGGYGHPGAPGGGPGQFNGHPGGGSVAMRPTPEQAEAARRRECERNERIGRDMQMKDRVRERDLNEKLMLEAVHLQQKEFERLERERARAEQQARDEARLAEKAQYERADGYEFVAPNPEFREELKEQYRELYVQPTSQLGEARELGLGVTRLADQTYSVDPEVASMYKDIGKDLLDLVVGIDPVTGLGRDAYELYTGKNLITGRELSQTERTFAFVGIATVGGSRYLTHAGRGMALIYKNAAKMIHDAPGFKTALDRGMQVIGKIEHSPLARWGKAHRIEYIEDAASANIRSGYANPPYKPDSYVVHFRTTKEQKFVRLSTEATTNPTGSWMVRAGEIKGLTPTQIADKLNLENIPTHLTDVVVPARTGMSRGMTNLNHWGSEIHTLEGQVQYRIETQIESSWFKNTRPL